MLCTSKAPRHLLYIQYIMVHLSADICNCCRAPDGFTCNNCVLHTMSRSTCLQSCHGSDAKRSAMHVCQQDGELLLCSSAPHAMLRHHELTDWRSIIPKPMLQRTSRDLCRQSIASQHHEVLELCNPPTGRLFPANNTVSSYFAARMHILAFDPNLSVARDVATAMEAGGAHLDRRGRHGRGVHGGPVGDVQF